MKVILTVFLLMGAFFPSSVHAREDAVSLAQIDAADGIDRDEANVIAREFFHRYVSPCGWLGDPDEKEGSFEYPPFFGKEQKPGAHPVVIDKETGQISMKEFSIPLDFTDIATQPPFEEILTACEASGEEDILAWERWLQKEKEADIHFYCPVTDYYTLLLDEDDYPPEALPLAPHQRFAYCKYGNPATMFAVLTLDKSERTQACADEELARVRAREEYEQQTLPDGKENEDGTPSRHFKLVSPHFAVVVYTAVYDVKNYNYWVDRAYELLRNLESAAVDCLCPADCPAR